MWQPSFNEYSIKFQEEEEQMAMEENMRASLKKDNDNRKDGNFVENVGKHSKKD